MIIGAMAIRHAQQIITQIKAYSLFKYSLLTNCANMVKGFSEN
jgi:hypothetical protein